MPYNSRRSILFLVKPKAIIWGTAILLLLYVAYRERRTEELVGCWDCGWETRQAFYLLIAASTLSIPRRWPAVVSLLAGVKVLCSVGYLAFWNDITEDIGFWHILKASLRWTYEAHPEFSSQSLWRWRSCTTQYPSFGCIHHGGISLNAWHPQINPAGNKLA